MPTYRAYVAITPRDLLETAVDLLGLAEHEVRAELVAAGAPAAAAWVTPRWLAVWVDPAWPGRVDRVRPWDPRADPLPADADRLLCAASLTVGGPGE